MNVLIIIGILLAVILVCILVFKESSGFTVTNYEFFSDKIKKEKFKIVLLADLHDTDFGNENAVLLQEIDKLDPDIVAFAGDMVTSCMEAEYDYEPTLRFIGRLAAKYPVYYGMGNHEERFRRRPDRFPGKYEDLTKKLRAAGAPILVNEKKEIPDAGVMIYGLDMEHQYYRKIKTCYIPDDYLTRIFGPLDADHVSILLAHNPEQFPKYAKWGPDFVFSGHVHGGVIRIPFLGGLVSPQLKLFPKYDAGEFKEGRSTMILSRGIGSHTTPIRILNKAEIVNIIIRKKK
ncbi:MAG TPA: metallophosphoesterase [Lachnospiraceae bacterium]|nr:metallophosphoesterase [Lachnospiraceae bacterium]